MVLIIVATGLLVLVLGWTGAIIEALMGGSERILFVGAGLIFVGLLIGAWIELAHLGNG